MDRICDTVVLRLRTAISTEHDPREKETRWAYNCLTRRTGGRPRTALRRATRHILVLRRRQGRSRGRPRSRNWGIQYQTAVTSGEKAAESCQGHLGPLSQYDSAHRLQHVQGEKNKIKGTTKKDQELISEFTKVIKFQSYFHILRTQSWKLKRNPW